MYLIFMCTDVQISIESKNEIIASLIFLTLLNRTYIHIVISGPSRLSSFLRLCYVAVCNNYAICNKLQTAFNCNAVCNTSYFKLRCDDNAICNVLQIASKFYHLKILKMRIKIDQRQNASLQSYLTMNSVRHQSIRARHEKVPINTTIVQNAILPPHFCENPFVRPSIDLFVRPSVCRKKP